MALVFATSIASPAHATFPGKNGKIAFVRSPTPTTKTVWVMNPDGTGQTSLATGKNPAWSADGSRIAFSQAGEIWTMDANGTNQARLTTAPTDEFDEGPAWSPDGKTIAFVRNHHCIGIDGFPTICGYLVLIDTDGTNERILTTPTGSRIDGSKPDWSPDGSKIALDYFGTATVNADGSGLKFIDPSGGRPSWSPGGIWLANTRFFQSDNYATFFVSPDGSTSKLVAQHTGISVWSPDGMRIVFQRWDTTTGGPDIYTMNDAGSDRVRLTFTAADRDPAWQPLPPAPTYAGYPRPKGATPFQTYFTVAYNQCTSPNRQHGPPLAVDSCSPPQQSSDFLTVGTLDSNGQRANSVGSLRLDVLPDMSATSADETDVKMVTSIKDVRCKDTLPVCSGGALSDYMGHVLVTMNLQATDRFNGGTGTVPATTVSVDGQFELPFRMSVPCSTTTDDTIGSLCTLSTTANSLAPRSAREGRRAIWQLGQVHVYDGGGDGDVSTDDNTLFMGEGIFVP